MEELFTIQFWLIPIIEGTLNGILIWLNVMKTLFLTPPMLYFTIIGTIAFLIAKDKKCFF